MKENRVNSCQWVSLLCCHEMSSHFHLWKICFPYLAEINVVSRCHKYENKFKNYVFAERLVVNSVTDILKTEHVFTPCSISNNN